MRVAVILPKPPQNFKEVNPELYDYLNRLVRSTENILYQTVRTYADRWQPTNVPATGNRSLNADTATLDETRKCLARLIQDLKDGGALSGPAT